PSASKEGGEESQDREATQGEKGEQDKEVPQSQEIEGKVGMTPQGFGFETRRGERRSGEDRRATQERRLHERRQRVVAVQLDQRVGPERRNRDRRAANGPRRKLSDRRNQSYQPNRGLRLTSEMRRRRTDGRGAGD